MSLTPLPLIENLLAPLTGPAAIVAQAEGGNPLLGVLPIVAMGVLAYFLFVVPQRTKDKKFQQMLADLKENDRIVTTGGLHGVVTSVQRDQGRLTLRVDEQSGVKIRVALWAIDSVLNADEK